MSECIQLVCLFSLDIEKVTQDAHPGFLYPKVTQDMVRTVPTEYRIQNAIPIRHTRIRKKLQKIKFYARENLLQK